MRHLKKRLKINRTSAHRDSMLVNMLNSFLKYERIKTTKAKAKLLKPVIEKIITKAKKDNTLHTKRLVYRYLRKWDMIPKLFEKIAPRYKNRPGGYTRIVPVGFRDSDGAEMVYLELVESYEQSDKSEETAK